MPRLITSRDLRPLDLLVLKDVVRFGVLATDQIERRYADAALAAVRLPILLSGDFISLWPNVIDGTSVYSATAYGARVAECGLRQSRPYAAHVPHDVALVDLADCLLAQDPGAEWRTEREATRFLGESGGRSRRKVRQKGKDHRPDGLLLSGGKRLAIELEHSGKSIAEYEHICRWFACSVQLDGVRWYVDDPKVGDRIRRVNRQHGFDLDVEVRIELFPPGVVIRNRVGPLLARRVGA